jgi:uncharacterized protein YqhQ
MAIVLHACHASRYLLRAKYWLNGRSKGGRAQGEETVKTHYGGQALIEGVLIRGRSGVFAAVRAPDGHIVTREMTLETARRGRVAKLPILRGIFALKDTFAFGTQMLMFSADVAAGGAGDNTTSIGKRAAFGAAGVAAGMFAVLPNLLAKRLGRRGRKDLGPSHGVGAHMTEGAIRVGVLLSYLAIIGRLKDVQRIFAYHGAEHKSISALEAGAALDATSVQEFDTAHPRCGTAFLLQSMLTSTAVYAAVGNRTPLGRIGTRIALIPLVAGLSFEVLQFNARHVDSGVVRALNAPGMLLQRMTTRQPTDDQVEVALSALRGAMSMDKQSE